MDTGGAYLLNLTCQSNLELLKLFPPYLLVFFVSYCAYFSVCEAKSTQECFKFCMNWLRKLSFLIERYGSKQ